MGSDLHSSDNSSLNAYSSNTVNLNTVLLPNNMPPLCLQQGRLQLDHNWWWWFFSTLVVRTATSWLAFIKAVDHELASMDSHSIIQPNLEQLMAKVEYIGEVDMTACGTAANLVLISGSRIYGRSTWTTQIPPTTPCIWLLESISNQRSAHLPRWVCVAHSFSCQGGQNHNSPRSDWIPPPPHRAILGVCNVLIYQAHSWPFLTAPTLSSPTHFPASSTHRLPQLAESHDSCCVCIFLVKHRLGL